MSESSQSSIEDCCLIDLPVVHDVRGNLSFIEATNHVPFKIARTHWIYDVPGGQSRGGHAHRTLLEFVVAISGSFDVTLDDGQNSKVIQLNRSYFGLLIPPLIWRSLNNFSTNSLCMIVASHQYDPTDYLRDYSEFTALKQ